MNGRGAQPSASRGTVRLLAGMLVGFGLMPAAVAVEITASPRLDLSSVQDSNVNFVDVGARDSVRLRALGSVNVDVGTLQNDYDLRMSVDHREVPELEQFSGTSYVWGVGWQQQRDRLQLGADVSFADLQTAFTEINEFGEIRDDQRQQTLTASASVIYSIDDRLTASASGGLTNSVIIRDVGGLVDYRQPFAQVTLAWEANEKLTFLPTVSWNRFSTPNAFPLTLVADENVTETWTARLAAERALGEATTISANIGARRSTIESAQFLAFPPFLDVIESTQTAVVFGAGISHAFERWQLDASILREVQPTVVGLAIEADNATLRLTRTLDERSRVFLDAAWNRSDNLNGVDSFINRERLRTTVRYSHDLSERWRVGGFVEGVWLAFSDASIRQIRGDRSRSAVGLEVRYAVDGLPLGR